MINVLHQTSSALQIMRNIVLVALISRLASKPSDDNAFSFPVFEGWSRLSFYTNVVRIVTFRKN